MSGKAYVGFGLVYFDADPRGGRGTGRRAKTLPLSVGVHAVLIAAALLAPLLVGTEVLPEPTAVARAFFVEPASAPPPPPPPPPAPAARTIPKAPPRPVEAAKFVAPVATPEEIRPEEGIDFGVPGGTEEGVPGGVPGGVFRGVVGGLPLATPPPPPPAPVRVGGQIRAPEKIRHVSPAYPDIAKQARVQGIVILECTISPQGKVADVKVLRGIPLLDQAATDAVKQWTYTPTLLNGVPVPVIMTVTVNFKLN